MKTLLCWGNKVSPEFRAKVLDICYGFNWTSRHASWLMACIAFESGETFSPSIVNAAGSGATGLIQFMPLTAKGMGTNIQALKAMMAVDQLEYVRRYFSPYYRKIFSLSDMYMAILMPKYVGKAEESVLFSEGAGYRQNAGLDTNKDGKITKAEASGKVMVKLTRGWQFAVDCEWSPPTGDPAQTTRSVQ